MIRVTPSQLSFAAALGRLRRRPPPSAGPANALRFHQLVYDGGPCLTFITTDFRVTLISQLRVDGAGDPWECRVPLVNFEAYAGSVGVEGGSLTLNPRSPRCVRAEKLSTAADDPLGREFGLAYPFFHFPDPTRYPCGELPGETDPVAIPRAALQQALAFVTPAQGERDTTTRLNSCTLTPAGDVVAYSEKVFFRAPAAPVPFEVNLLSPDAARLGSWLSLLGGDPSPEVTLTRGNDPGGRLYYQFRTPDHGHTFRVVAAPRPVPYEFVQQARDEPAAISGVVSGQTLHGVAGYFSQFRRRPLDCRFVKDAAGWRLRLTTTGDAPEGGGSLALDDCHVLDQEVSESPLLVSPVHLRLALARHRLRRLQLSYHPAARAITLTDNVPSGRGPTGGGYQSLVRVAASRPGPDA